MRYQLLIGISLLVMGLFFVFVEVLIAPEVLRKTMPVVREVASGETPLMSVETPTAPVAAVAAISVEDFFANAKLLASKGVTLIDGRQETALFSQIALDPNVEPFVLHSWQIQRDGQPIGTVVDITSKTETGVTTAFLQLRRYIESVLEQTSSAGEVTAVYHTRGEDNFYLNNPTDFPSTVFMVVRSGQKILAFTYNIAYHEPHCEQSPQVSPETQACRGGELKALIPLFF